MDLTSDLKQAVCEGDEIKAVDISERALQEGAEAHELMHKGAVAGIQEAGRLWQEEEYFLPDIILATEAYKEAMKVIEPRLAREDLSFKGKVILGSVEGDAHDIGKNIVISLLRCNSYEVVDLGVDVPLQDFVDKARELEPDVLGMGAYMTTTMRGMGVVIRSLEEAGLRDKVKVIIGGAAVTKDYATGIGADGYGENAATAVELVDGLMGVS